MFDGITIMVAASLIKWLVIVVLLTSCKFDFLRVAYTWPFIALGNYWLFSLAGGLLLVVLPVSDELRKTLVFPIISLLVLALLVLIEAWVITALAKRKFYRESVDAFSKRSALGVSVAGNLVPLTVGIWVIALRVS